MTYVHIIWVWNLHTIGILISVLLILIGMTIG